MTKDWPTFTTYFLHQKEPLSNSLLRAIKAEIANTHSTENFYPINQCRIQWRFGIWLRFLPNPIRNGSNVRFCEQTLVFFTNAWFYQTSCQYLDNVLTEFNAVFIGLSESVSVFSIGQYLWPQELPKGSFFPPFSQFCRQKCDSA